MVWPSRLVLQKKAFGSGLYTPLRGAYRYCNIFFDKVSFLKHPNAHSILGFEDHRIKTPNMSCQKHIFLSLVVTESLSVRGGKVGSCLLHSPLRFIALWLTILVTFLVTSYKNIKNNTTKSKGKVGPCLLHSTSDLLQRHCVFWGAFCFTLFDHRDYILNVKYWIEGTFYWPTYGKKWTEYILWNSSRGQGVQ